jgi:putative membrane protein
MKKSISALFISTFSIPVLVATILASISFTALADAGPNDAQIAAIVVAANTVDVNAGELARTKASKKEVKDFAERMIVDHKGVNAQAVELVTKLKVTPQENPTSQSLKNDGDKKLAELRNLNGAAFDKAYVDNEVAYHQAVLDAVDKVLIPNANNAELKALLVKVRPAFVAHLEHAKHIQTSLK